MNIPSNQEDFDASYVTSSEICERVGIHRTTVLLAIDTLRLPKPIRIMRPNGATMILIWPRGQVEDIIIGWKPRRTAQA